MSSEKRKTKRPMRQAPSGSQIGLGLDVGEDEGSEQAKRTESVEVEGRQRRFIDNDPRDIYIGDVSLEDYLLSQQLDWVFAYRHVLVELDWSEWGDRYEPVGRPPYHPAPMAGIILYGMAEGCQSLRKIEEMARKDLVCWWVSGGIQPDHSTLGRFIVRHADQLREVLFEETTAEILELMPQLDREVSGDGTTIESVASRLSELQKEAAEQWAEEVLEHSDASKPTEEVEQADGQQNSRNPQQHKTAPSIDQEADRDTQTVEADQDVLEPSEKGNGSQGDDVTSEVPTDQRSQQDSGQTIQQQELDAQQKRAKKVLKIVQKRADKRKGNGADPEKTRMSRTDPEAMYLKHKDDTYQFGYVPSIMGNRQRFILSYGVEPGSETAVIDRMVDQTERIIGAVVGESKQQSKADPDESTDRETSLMERLMLDAGYYSLEILEMAVERGLDLLVPTEDYFTDADEMPEDGIPRQRGKLAKRAFELLSDDQMLCPMGHSMEPIASGTNSRINRQYNTYRCSECDDCPMRADCTSSQKGRTVQYFEGDQYKEAMRQVMKQPRVRPIYARRFGAVEPIFSDLQQQGMTRSSRRGLDGTRTEVGLHCTGYNFRRLKTMVKKGVVDARQFAPGNNAHSEAGPNGGDDAKIGASRSSFGPKPPLWMPSSPSSQTLFGDSHSLGSVPCDPIRTNHALAGGMLSQTLGH